MEVNVEKWYKERNNGRRLIENIELSMVE